MRPKEESHAPVARREFIRRLGLGAAGAAALALTHRPPPEPRPAERIRPVREAEFYRNHDLAG